MPLAATQILTTASTNGNGTAYDFSGGVATLTVQGTFDGATAKLQHSLDGGTTYVDCDSDNASFTAAGQSNVELAAGKVRMNLASAGGSTSIDAYMRMSQRIH